MITQICKWMACPVFVLAAIVVVSALSLAAAYTAQYAFGLEPCILCLYQRIPFAVAIVLGLAGLALRDRPLAVRAMIGLSGLAFLSNALIAAYHTGVEQHWWRSAVEGCAVPGMTGETQNLLDTILQAPAARCDQIAWADPIFGLSMANYNIALNAGLFVFCLLALYALRTRPSQSSMP